MYCGQCGRKLEDNTAFCDYCGVRIDKKQYGAMNDIETQNEDSKDSCSNHTPYISTHILMIVISVILFIISIPLVIRCFFYFSLVNKLTENETILNSWIQEVEILRETVVPQADYIYNTLTSFDAKDAAKNDDTVAVDALLSLYEKIDQINADGEELSLCLGAAKKISYNAHVYAENQLKSGSENDEIDEPYFDMEDIANRYTSQTDTLITRYDDEKDYLRKHDDPQLSDLERIALEQQHGLDGLEYDSNQEIHNELFGEIKNGDYFLTVGNDEDFKTELTKEINQYSAIRSRFLIGSILIIIGFIICLASAIIMIKNKFKNKQYQLKNGYRY